MRVHARSHRGPSQRYLCQLALCVAHACYPALDLSRVTQKFLPQANRRGILQVRAARLDDRHKLVGFLLQRLLQSLERRYQVMLNAEERREMDGAGYDIV